MTQTIVHVRNLHAWYDTSHVLQGVDLTIEKGQTVGLLGRNGMGKSTLIRSVLGHVAKRTGEIVVFGKDVSRARPHQLARLGVAYVPEGRGIFPNLTVRENLVMAARPAANATEAYSLEVVLTIFPRLSERLANMGSELSGGEQQMLAIGRALMTHPELLILDEATEGLAPLLVQEIWRVIAQIKTA
jgi:branched-chain amino acid transport system ATP-binding protein